MVWFKVDDALSTHIKAFQAGNKALGLWVRAGSWSGHQLSDGFIPAGVVPALGGDWDDAAALVNAGLWHQTDGGYQFHDWAEYQPTKEKVLAERAAATERKQVSRARAKGSQRDVAVTEASVTVPRPVPTRPTDSTHVNEVSPVTERARKNDQIDIPQADLDKAYVASVTDDGIDVHSIHEALWDMLGIRATEKQAAWFALETLDKSKEKVDRKTAYVMKTIRKSGPEVADYFNRLGTP